MSIYSLNLRTLSVQQLEELLSMVDDELAARREENAAHLEENKKSLAAEEAEEFDPDIWD